MNIRRAGALSVAFCVALLLCFVPPAHAEWRDGACEQGEGQSVIVDWSLTPDVGSGTELIRCIILNSESYPETGPAGQGTQDVLLSAGIPHQFNGLISNVNNIPTPEGHSWHYTGGRDGGWLGIGYWLPEPDVDTFVGIMLVEDGAQHTPVRVPAFQEPSDPGPSEEPSEDPGPSEGPGPSEDPSDDPSGGPAPSPEPEPEPTPGPEPDQTPTPTAPAPSAPPVPPSTDQPTRTPTPSASTTPPTATPTPSNSPTPTPSPSATPTVAPTPTPSDDPEIDGENAPIDAPSESPSPVWGREDSGRQPPESVADVRAPASSWLSAAFAVVVLGGLGTAAGLGLRSSSTAPVEDE